MTGGVIDITINGASEEVVERVAQAIRDNLSKLTDGTGVLIDITVNVTPPAAGRT